MAFGRYMLKWCWLVAFAGVGLLAGCAELDVGATLPLLDRSPQPKVPARVSAIWTDTILNQSGQAGVRGFGGRVMFFEADSEEPITVDGTITVYAFDETDSKAHHTVPRRKYVFTSEQLPEHYSKSALGPSYSLWLPWDEVGGPPQQISLVLKFEGRLGGAVTTESTRQLLPGIVMEPPQDDSPTIVDRQNISREGNGGTAALDYVELRGTGKSSHIELAGHEVPADDSATNHQPARPSPTATSSTTTINMPPAFARRNLTATAGVEIVTEASAYEGGGAHRQPQPAPRYDDRAEASPVEGLSHPGGRSIDRGTAQPAVNSSAPSASEAGAFSRSARYGFQRFRARTRSAVQSGGDPVRRQPHPATWPSALQPTPRHVRDDVWSAPDSADWQESN